MYPDNQQEVFFEQRNQGNDYYETNANQIDSMMPEFIGMSNKVSAMQSYNSVDASPESQKKRVSSRVRSQLDRSSLSRASVDYDAPLTVTGLNILDSIPMIDDLGLVIQTPGTLRPKTTIRDPVNKMTTMRSQQHSIEKTARKPRF